jgi:chorismate synthase
MNSFGYCFRITTFGESHGPALGCVIDGCPAQIKLTEADIQDQLDRRKPGQSEMTTPRKEADRCEILSGVFEGETTGMPIAVIVRNENQNSKDYENIKDLFRPSHADFGYWKKYGVRDYRGGGRASARETIGRVIGGAVARKILREKWGLEIYGFTRSIGSEVFMEVDQGFIEKNSLRMADQDAFAAAEKKLLALKAGGDSIGGTIEIRVKNMLVGLGSPVFAKLEAELARGMMSVPAVKGFEMGEGFSLCEKTGEQANDPFLSEGGDFRTQRNANGGVLGGISTGDDLWFRVGIKPTSSIFKPQKTADKYGEMVDFQIQGRHDPVLMPRAIPILEAMTALVLLDHVLLDQAQKINPDPCPDQIQ